MFAFEYDQATGIVRCHSNRFLSVGDLEAHARQVKDTVDRAKRELGYVHLLVIATEAKVQSSAVMDQVVRMQDGFMTARDRMAMVVTSALVRLQVARTIASDRVRTFQTEADALAWLGAERPRRCAA